MSTTVEYDILVEVLDSIKDLKKLSNQTKKNKKEFDGTKKSGVAMAGSLGAAFVGLQAAAGAVVGAVQKVTGAIVGAAEASFEMTRAVVDNINDLNDLSARSSISAQNIEALKLAFESSGQSADNAKTIISQFPRALTAIQKEGSQANKVLKALGVDEKSLKDGNQAFVEAIRALEGIEDQTVKAQAANVIFGRSAGDLLQALGAGEFDEFTASIERYGTKAGPEASAQAAEFQKRLAAINMIIARATQEFVINTGAMDFFISALNTAQQAIAGLNAFMQSGQKGIRALAGDIFSFLVTAFQVLAQKVGDFILGPWLSMLRAFDTFQQKFTGKSLFAEAIKGIGSFVLEQYELTDAIDAAKAAFDAEGDAIRASSIATKENTKDSEGNKDALKGLIDALKGKKNATKESNKETSKANSLLKIRQGALDALADANKKYTQGIEDVRSILKDAGSDQLSNLDKINQLEQSRLDKLILIGKQTGLNTEAAEEAVRARAERERAAERRRQVAGTIAGVGGAVGALSSPQALADFAGGLAGPIGSAVSGVLGGLAGLGDVSGIEEDRLQKVMEETGKSRDEAMRQILIDDKAAEFEIFFEAIVRGLTLLPPILLKTLPKVLLPAALSIVDAIIMLPFQIAGLIGTMIADGAKMIGEFIKDLSPMSVLKKLFSSIMKAINDFVKAVFGLDMGFGGESFMSGGRFLSAQGGLRFTGASQGLAMLHQGEMVVPRSGQMSSSVARDVEAQIGGGGVTININSAVTERSAIDSLVRKIEQRFGGFGQSTSPLFGGR